MINPNKIKIHTSAEINAMSVEEFVKIQPLVEISRNQIDIRAFNRHWQLLNLDGDLVIDNGVGTNLSLREIDENDNNDMPTIKNQLATNGKGSLFLSVDDGSGFIYWKQIM
jgi:hypothetical protein